MILGTKSPVQSERRTDRTERGRGESLFAASL
jgi:hypothetical protein